MLRYVDDLLLCSPSQAFSQEDSIHLLKLLASEGHKGRQRKTEVCPNPDSILGHLKPEQGLLLDPDKLHGVLSFPKPKTKHQL